MDWYFYSWPTLILLGVGLRMSIRLTYGARGPEAGDPIYVFLNTASWVLIGLGLGPVVAVGAATFVGGLFALLAATTLVEISIQQRIAQRRSMSTMLALLVERGQRLDSSVLFAGQAMRGIVGRAAARLLEALGKGTPLAQAVAANPRALPPEAMAYVSAGQTMKSEAAALRELSRGDTSGMSGLWRATVDRLCYLIFVVVVMAGVATFIMIKILPEFEKIFSEFDLEVPRITRLMIELADFFTAYLAAPLGLALSLCFVCAIAVGICYLFDLPVLRPWSDLLFRGRRSSHVLRILAVATEQRQPLAEVLQRISHVYPSAPIRSRLEPAAAAVRAGADWRDALLKSRVVTRGEHGLLKSAERAGNLPWALREIAKRREKRAAYRAATALQVFYPLTILLMGAFVGFFVVSLFLPIVKLIEALT